MERTHTAGKATKRFDLAQALDDFEGGRMGEEDVIGLFQFLIDSGLAWSLQGSYGRLAHELLESGLCVTPGTPIH